MKSRQALLHGHMCTATFTPLTKGSAVLTLFWGKELTMGFYNNVLHNC